MRFRLGNLSIGGVRLSFLKAALQFLAFGEWQIGKDIVYIELFEHLLLANLLDDLLLANLLDDICQAEGLLPTAARQRPAFHDSG
jgi:hypothetical protein